MSNLSSYPEQAPDSVTLPAHLTFLRLSFLIGTLRVEMVLSSSESSKAYRLNSLPLVGFFIAKM